MEIKAYPAPTEVKFFERGIIPLDKALFPGGVALVWYFWISIKQRKTSNPPSEYHSPACKKISLSEPITREPEIT